MNEVSKATHTPGPWVATESLFIRTRDGSTLAEVRYDDFYDTDLITQKPVRDEAQGHANARLIAAAPEMLEALEKVAGHFLMIATNNQPLESYAVDFNAAQAAIKKARGTS